MISNADAVAVFRVCQLWDRRFLLWDSACLSARTS